MRVLNLLLYLFLLHGSSNANVETREKREKISNKKGHEMVKILKNNPKIKLINGDVSKLLPGSLMTPSEFRKIHEKAKKPQPRFKPDSKIAKLIPEVRKKTQNVVTAKPQSDIYGNEKNFTDINTKNDEIKDKTVRIYDNQDKDGDIAEETDENENILISRQGNVKKDDITPAVEDIITKDTTNQPLEFIYQDESSRSGHTPNKINITLSGKTGTLIDRIFDIYKNVEQKKSHTNKTSAVITDLKTQTNKSQNSDTNYNKLKMIQSIHLKEDLAAKILQNRLNNKNILLDLKELDQTKSNTNTKEKEVSIPKQDKAILDKAILDNQFTYYPSNDYVDNLDEADDNDYMEPINTYKKVPLRYPNENNLVTHEPNNEDNPANEVNVFKDEQNSFYSYTKVNSVDAKKGLWKSIHKVQLKLPDNLVVLQNIDLWMKLLQMCASCRQMKPCYYKSQYPQKYGYLNYPRYYQYVSQDNPNYYQQFYKHYYDAYKNRYYQKPWSNQNWNKPYLLEKSGVAYN